MVSLGTAATQKVPTRRHPRGSRSPERVLRIVERRGDESNNSSKQNDKYPRKEINRWRLNSVDIAMESRVTVDAAAETVWCL